MQYQSYLMKGGANMQDIDFLIIGSGLCGSVIARELTDKGHKCVVLEQRPVIGGNIRTEKMDEIDVHMYGAHIFRTSDDRIWQYVNRFAEFNNFINSPIANYKGEIYNLPFNMNTFNKLWGVVTPDEAKKKIESQRVPCDDPQNLEEYVLNLVGKDIYRKLIKGYTEKQWGKSCQELDKSIIRRIPLRFTYNNNYFNEKYQGIPVEGYTRLIEALLEGVEVHCGCNYTQDSKTWRKRAKKVIYTGPLDEYYNYCFGKLEYRSLKFITYMLTQENYQGNAVINYTGKDVPYTRVIEHKHFTGINTPYTVITEEYPQKWIDGRERYYPIEDQKNLSLYHLYEEKAKQDGLIIAGRLAEYKYYDMDDTIKSAFNIVQDIEKGGL